MEYTVGIFILIIVVPGVALLCRELVCWYWKQNAQVKLLTEIKDLLNEQNNILIGKKKSID